MCSKNNAPNTTEVMMWWTEMGKFINGLAIMSNKIAGCVGQKLFIPYFTLFNLVSWLPSPQKAL